MANAEKESGIVLPTPLRLADDLIAEFQSANADLQDAIERDDGPSISRCDGQISGLIERMMDTTGLNDESRRRLYRFLFENVVSLEIEQGSFAERLIVRLLKDMEPGQRTDS